MIFLIVALFSFNIKADSTPSLSQDLDTLFTKIETTKVTKLIAFQRILQTERSHFLQMNPQQSQSTTEVIRMFNRLLGYSNSKSLTSDYQSTKEFSEKMKALRLQLKSESLKETPSVALESRLKIHSLVKGTLFKLKGQI